MPIKTILFDINETVLDLKALKPLFEAMFADQVHMGQWFASLLHSSNIANITNVKTNFRELVEVCLDKFAAEFDISPENSKRDEIINAFKALPPHDDIIPALQLLQDHKFKTIAYSNSSNQLLNDQIANAGLSAYFDDIISVENSGYFKPFAAAYQHAETILSMSLSNMRLVAAHDWDTHGAMSAGMAGAFINRKKTIYNKLYLQPDITGTTMVEIAEKIITAEQQKLG